MSAYALHCSDPYLSQRAKQLVAALGCPLLSLDAQIEGYEWLLVLTADGLHLKASEDKKFNPIKVDFLAGANAHRRNFGGGKGQMIAKAVGIKSGVRPKVVDLTAGLGQDAFVLANLGCSVTLFERSPVVHALLEDGLLRAQQDVEVAAITANMKLYLTNAIDWLEREREAKRQHSVIYLDPMFPEREKSALVKKEMRIFRTLVGEDLDASQLLEAALEVAEHRVVVKRPRKASSINDRTPSYQLLGKSSRYDIYSLKKLI